MRRFDHLAPLLARRLRSGHLQVNEPMALHTSFGIGGPADLLVEPVDLAELRSCLRFSLEHGVPRVAIGLGTNLLVRDGGYRGMVVKLTRLTGIAELGHDGQERRLRAAAGVPLHEVAQFAAERGMTGLEFACGIPGTLGGAVAMNAGAYGGEMAQVVEECLVVNPDGSTATLRHQDLAFGYRASALQDGLRIAVEATLKLGAASPPEIRRLMEEYRRRRRERQPLDEKSAGSVFRRPPGQYAGALIEAAGLKGLRVGGAEVSRHHAGFIVNCGNATARDVLALMELIRRRVLEHSGVELEPELRIIGEDEI